MDPSERILNLATFLLSARRPVTSADIYEAFPDEYTGSAQTQDRKLSRDKEQLRALGVSVVSVSADEEGDEKGVRVDRAEFCLPDIALTPEERAALFAVGAAALEAGFPLHAELALALTKLRTAHGDDREVAAPVVISQGERRSRIEALITEAVVRRRRLILRYPPEMRDRRVDPYATSLRRNRFSFVGYCHLRKAVRTFHVDRIDSCRFAAEVAAAPEFEPPAGFDPAPHLPAHAWQIRLHAPVDVTIDFPSALAESGPVALGIDPGRPCMTTNLDGLIAELLALGEGVRIAAPEKARERMRHLLRGLQARVREAT